MLHQGVSLMPPGSHMGSHLAASQAQAVANVEFLKRQLEARSHLVQAQVQRTGAFSEILKVAFSDGSEVFCTEAHKPWHPDVHLLSC